MIDLSIIIVNWNSIRFTKDCIRSIRSTVANVDYEVIVVDNASNDDFGCIPPEEIAEVRLIRLESNVGFAGANNVGAEYARGKKLLFLNPDTLVLGDAIERMMWHLDSDHGIGAIGCRLLNTDLTLQTTSVQPFPTILNQLLSIGWLQRRWPKLSFWGTPALYAEKSSGLHEVEVVSGACVMVRSEVFEHVGRFSTDYFMYAEEADLCYRIRRAGWKVCHIPEAEIVHFGGQSTKKRGDAFSDIALREAVFKLLRTFRGNTYAFLYRAALFLSALVRLLALSPWLLIPQGLLNREPFLQAFRKWTNIAAWSLAISGRRTGGIPTNSVQ